MLSFVVDLRRSKSYLLISFDRKPKFNSSDQVISTAPVWANLYNPPFEYWKKHVHLQVVTRVGRLLNFDETTVARSNGQICARVKWILICLNVLDKVCSLVNL